MAKSLMIDIETLDTAPSAAITSIGAVFFDAITGEIFEKFYRQINAYSNQIYGRTIGYKTFEFWVNQPKKARKNLFIYNGKSPVNDLEAALNQLHQFITSNTDTNGELEIWANSPAFDAVILNHAYDSIKSPPPWEYWQWRDMRTVAKIFPIKKKTPKHHALDDCFDQIKIVCKFFQTIHDTKSVLAEYKEKLQLAEKALNDVLTWQADVDIDWEYPETIASNALEKLAKMDGF